MFYREDMTDSLFFSSKSVTFSPFYIDCMVFAWKRKLEAIKLSRIKSGRYVYVKPGADIPTPTPHPIKSITYEIKHLYSIKPGLPDPFFYQINN